MIFMTGGTGFVGQRLIARLLEDGISIRALIRAGQQPPLQHARLEWRSGDITDRASLEGGFDGIETIVHLAAIIGSARDATNETVNAESTRTLTQLCRLHKIDRFILMSAAAAKFRCLNAYGRSKKRAEEIVTASGLDYAILRAPLIIGRGSKEWERFVEYVRKIPMIVPVFGDGRAIKRPIHIDDAVAALAALVKRKPLGGRLWEIACRESLTLDQLIDLTCAQLGLRKHKFHVPLNISLMLAGMAERILGDRAPITRDIVTGLNQDVIFDAQPAYTELGLLPRPVAEAIAEALQS